MNLQNAKEIGKKARAYEHCARILKQIEKNGSAVMKVNCTGIEFHIQKGDGIHLRLKTIFSALAEELAAFSARRPVIAPVGSAPEEEIRKQKRREYNRQYYATHKELYKQYRKNCVKK